MRDHYDLRIALKLTRSNVELNTIAGVIFRTPAYGKERGLGVAGKEGDGGEREEEGVGRAMGKGGRDW